MNILLCEECKEKDFTLIFQNRKLCIDCYLKLTKEEEKEK